MTYIEFLKRKMDIASETGFDVDISEMNSKLKPHQKTAVQWAIKGGRRAVFMAFGLGKTIVNLEICRLIIKHKDGKALIVLPLGVKQEFKHDAVELLGMEPPKYVTCMKDIHEATEDILMTNYERVRDGDIDPTYFTVCTLDEAAVLRSYGSDTYQTFMVKFKGIKYKFVFTATPSPNRYKELIHYAAFLEIMDSGQALTRFFQRDSTKANNLTLYPHRQDEFWLWCSSWGLWITIPSNLGPEYSDKGYDLPPLEVRYHEIPVERELFVTDRDGQIRMQDDEVVSLPDAMKEKRRSIGERVSKMMVIINESPNDHFVLWHDLEDERKAIKKALPQAVDIYGSQDYELREQSVVDFSEGRSKYFATKKELSGSGCNFQRHCHREIFIGIDYEFNDFIQAIHRVYRFLQTEKVIIDIIYTSREKRILQVLLKKWEQYKYQVKKMTDIIKKYGLSTTSMTEKMSRTMGVKRVEVKGKNFIAVNNDSILEFQNLPDNYFDLLHTSIPFGNHYEYSASYNDFGFNPDTEAFMEQMDYLTPNLLRTLKPGRIFACHVKDRVLFGNTTGTGMPTMEPFHALCIQHYMKHGFQYFGMITVVTDVVRENNQTYRLGWTEQCKDGTKMGVGCPEYILLFRKLPTDTSNAYADVPVSKSKEEYTRAQWQIDAHGFHRTSGDRLLTKSELESIPVNKLQAAYLKYSRNTIYNYKEHIELAKKLDENGKLPASFMVVAPGSWNDQVWDDILRMKTLNAKQTQKRLQNHVCPLQIDIVERIINRYSNPGELVGDPFGGLMTVPKVALDMGRKGWGCELNYNYFRDGVGYLKVADEDMKVPSLFDFFGEE